jgi:NADPH2:quinone reductase
MKCWQAAKFCEPEELRFIEAPLPQPRPGSLRIRVHAAGLNFFDILQIQGKYQAKPIFPFTPGAEVAGVVDALGPDVDSFAPGDRVVSYCGSGGYAEFAIGAAARTFPIPGAMSFAEAAAMLLVYQTSYFALDHRARLRAGEWLLVHAGASGVGMAAIQLGVASGARVMATAGSADKLEFCRQQGARHAFDYRTDSWVEPVKQVTSGRGADVICDPVGGDVFDLSSKCIAPGGRLLVVGFASGRIPSIAANRLLLKNMSAVGVFWGRHVDENPAYFAAAQRELFRLYQEGKIRPAISEAYPLAGALQALADLAGRRVMGKAVLTVA